MYISEKSTRAMVSEVAKSFKDKKCLEKKIIFNILAGLSKSSEDVQKRIEMIKKLKRLSSPCRGFQIVKAETCNLHNFCRRNGCCL